MTGKRVYPDRADRSQSISNRSIWRFKKIDLPSKEEIMPLWSSISAEHRDERVWTNHRGVLCKRGDGRGKRFSRQVLLLYFAKG